MSLEKTHEHILAKNCLIQIFGLGYVGFPLAIRLSSAGFKVIGVDLDSKKIKNLKNKSLTDYHQNLRTIFLESLQSGSFNPSTKPLKSDLPQIAIICVPTPIPDKDISTDVFVRAAVEDFLEIANDGDVIILESSIEIGTTEKMAKIIESKGFKIGENFGLCYCPERIDPLNKKWKLENIPRVIFCSDDISYQIAQKIYEHVNNSNLVRVDSPKVAEVVKSFENAFRLVNISLVNELAILCDKLKINVKDVIDAASTKPFGFMPFYSGAGVGGHCIPKDPRFLLESAKKMGIPFDSIENALTINANIPKYIVDSIEKALVELNLKKSVLVCSLSYKPNIEDMRDSPGFRISSELCKRGFEVAAYDPYYKPELLNKYLIENHLQKLDFNILQDLDDNSLQNFSCLCIVQHHNKIKTQIDKIYRDSKIALIYDCQNNMKYEPKSQTILKCFGS